MAQWILSAPRIHNRSKHIDIHFHFVREKYEQGAFEIMWVDSANNLADILTKSLPKVAHEWLYAKLQNAQKHDE